MALRKMATYNTGVVSVEKSGNKKTGLVSATYVSQSTCPVSCPLKNAGCYAEKGPMAIHTSRLNKSSRRADAIARTEADAIDGLSGRFDLRVHVVGDCRTANSARTVSAAMERYRARSHKTAWTYTHAWRTVPRSAWGNANVIASCDTLAETEQARERGYATVLVARKGSDLFNRMRAGKREGNLLPCPNQTHDKKPTCVDCRLCLRPAWMTQTNTTIVFLEH